jgi:hypothetical protein
MAVTSRVLRRIFSRDFLRSRPFYSFKFFRLLYLDVRTISNRSRAFSLTNRAFPLLYMSHPIVDELSSSALLRLFSGWLSQPDQYLASCDHGKQCFISSILVSKVATRTYVTILADESHEQSSIIQNISTRCRYNYIVINSFTFRRAVFFI